MTVVSGDVADFCYFLQLSSRIIGAVSVIARSMTVRNRMRTRVVTESVLMTDGAMAAGVAAVESSSVSIAAGILTEMPGDHADQHVAEAEHCADNVQSSECS